MAKPLDTALFRNILHPKKRAVLMAYVEMGRVKAACDAAHTPFAMHYYWLKHDPAYVDAFEEARKIVAVTLEDEAIRRAKAGVERTIYYQGVPCGTEHRYSDTMLIFLLKGALPEKYAENVEHHVSGQVEHTHAWQERLTTAHTGLEERRNGTAHPA